MTTIARPKSNKSSVQKLFGSIFGRNKFSNKCKREANFAIQRINLLKKRKEVVIRIYRDDVANILKSNEDRMQSLNLAKKWVGELIGECNLELAYEILTHYFDILLQRLELIESHRYCPPDMIETISSFIYATGRCSEISELARLRHIFKKKYGADFIHSAENLLPDSGVSAELITKLSTDTPTDELILQVLKEITVEYNIELGGADSVDHHHREDVNENDKGSLETRVSTTDSFQKTYVDSELETDCSQSHTAGNKLPETIVKPKLKTPPYVHPKHPDYEDIVRKIENIRSNSQQRKYD